MQRLFWMWQHPMQMAEREPCWSAGALPTSQMWLPPSRASFRWGLANPVNHPLAANVRVCSAEGYSIPRVLQGS